jgi:hypothetical protein
VYRIPEVSEIFKLYRVRALTFLMQQNLWGGMNLGSNSVAVNNRGYSFNYKPEDCEWAGGSAMCHADRVEVHSKPQTCAEELVVCKGINNKCLESVVVTTLKGQQYVYHTDSSLISVVSANSDKAVIRCGNKKPTEVVISVGLNIVMLPEDCVCTTNELVIYSVSKTTSGGVVPLIINGSYVKSVESLTDDIAIFHGMNFSEIERDISRFFKSVQTMSIDVANVQKSIADFHKI